MTHLFTYTLTPVTSYQHPYYLLPWSIPDLPKSLCGRTVSNWEMERLADKALEIHFEATRHHALAAQAYAKAKKAHWDKEKLFNEANALRFQANCLTRQCVAHFAALRGAHPLPK